MTEPVPAELEIAPVKRAFWRNLSLVWLVPVLALAVSLGLAWQTYANRGVLIEITFQSAGGVTAGQTTLRYRDVTIGKVEDVGFTPDLTKVLVTARVDREVAPFLDDEAAFWIVSPRVTASGVSGLSTVLSGVYIEGAWDQKIGAAANKFIGSDRPPLVQPGRAGKRITLKAEHGRLLDEGAPVYYRGVSVGRLERPRLTASSEIVVDAFIEAPHDSRLDTSTRFWSASGVSVSLGAGGLSVDFESVASMIAGGVNFDSIYEGGVPVNPGHVFSVYTDESQARRSLFARAPAEAVEVAAAFDESVAGLEPGAAVRYNGLTVGEVVAITADIEETDLGPELRPMARLAIEPEKLGLPGGAGREEMFDFLEEAVEQGLRAQLATTSIFSGALVVELTQVEDAPPAKFDRHADPTPVLPSAASNLPDFTATAEGIFDRINALPIEEIMQQAISMMAGVDQIVRRESTLRVPDEVAALLADTRALINDTATRELPAALRQTVAELNGAIVDFRASGAIERLNAALTNFETISANFAVASAALPGLVTEFQAVAEKANALDAEELVAAATSALEKAGALIASDDVQAIPTSLRAALNEANAALTEVRAGGAVERLTAAIANFETASGNIASASETLPQLIADLRAVAEKANALNAEELVAAATAALESAEALIDSEAARALPASMKGALDEVTTVLAELRAGGVIENANATMGSAREAADAVAKAAGDLPALTARLESLIVQVETVMAAYGGRSQFNRETVATLHEVQEAARAVAKLARTIERKPNSLLVGR